MFINFLYTMNICIIYEESTDRWARLITQDSVQFATTHYRYIYQKPSPRMRITLDTFRTLEDYMLTRIRQYNIVIYDKHSSRAAIDVNTITVLNSTPILILLTCFSPQEFRHIRGHYILVSKLAQHCYLNIVDIPAMIPDLMEILGKLSQGDDIIDWLGRSPALRFFKIF